MRPFPGPRVLAACVAIAVAITGCEEAPTAALLDVTAVGPARIDPGHRLVVDGSGFAVGHDVEVALVGTLARPFETDELVDEAFPAEAVAEDRVEMLVSETLLRERFGRATFRGRVEVRFDAQWDERGGTISGALDECEIDFVPTREAGLDGTTLEEALGVQFADVADEGLELVEVGGGAGAGLGLSPGDAIVAIGHARLVPGDAPHVPDDASTTTLTILREGRTAILEVDLGTHARPDGGSSEPLRLLQLAALLLFAALLGAWPFAITEVGPTEAPPALSRPTLALVVRALVGLVITHLAMRGVGLLPPVGLVVAMVVGSRAAIAIAGSPRGVAQLPSILISSIALAVALGALPSVLDVSSVAMLAEPGSAMPLDWPLFREPVGVLALVLLALAAGTARPTRPLARTLDDASLLFVAMLAVLAGTGLSPSGRAGSIATDVAVVAVAWLLGRAREHVRSSVPVLALALALSLGVVVLAGVWVIADPEAHLRRSLAEVSLVAVLLTTAFALRAALRGRAASRAQHALL